MIRIEIELSAPDKDLSTVLSVAGLIAGGAKERLENVGIVVHRITVEEADA